MGLEETVRDLAAGRRYEFDLERAVYLTVLHRLFASGSDRAMGWLGEELGPGLPVLGK